MKEFASVELQLSTDVATGQEASLLTLFSAAERFRNFDVLWSAEEDSTIRVVAGGLGRIDLRLGNDIERGEKKNIMTLFWYSERSKPIAIESNGRAGDRVTVNMYLRPKES